MLLLTSRSGGLTDLGDVAGEAAIGKPGLQLHYRAHEFHGRAVSIWLIQCERRGDSGWVHGSPSETHDARELRLLLQRLHSEIECLRWVLEHLSTKRLVLALGSAPTSELEKYAKTALNLLTAKHKYGVRKDLLPGAAFEAMRNASDPDIPQLVERLENLLRDLAPYYA